MLRIVDPWHKKPYDPRQPEKQLRKKPMTIALGFSCLDGIVLAADTEYSYGDLTKVPGPKVFTLSDMGDIRGIMTGAGDSAFLSTAAERISGVMRAANIGQEDFQEKVHEILIDLHERDLYPANDPSLAFELLIAVWFAGGPCYLLATERTLPYKIEGCKPIGYGSFLAAYVLDSIYEIGSVADAELLATYTLKIVKAHVQKCGGGSHVVAIDKGSGKVSNLTARHIARTESFFSEFSNWTKLAFSIMTAPPEDEEVFEELLEELADAIKRFRADQRTRLGSKGIPLRPSSDNG